MRAETFAFSTADAERILFPATNQQDAYPLSTEEMKMKLMHLKKKEIRMKLHGSTLSEYWRNKRIPQGLRIQKPPTIGKENEDFNKRWCEILNKCSMDLILLIIEEVSKQKKDIEKQIENQEINMKEKLGENFTQICDTTKQTLKEFEEYLMTTKLRKYRRDAYDYEHGDVYKWMNGNEHQGGPTQQRHRQHSSSISTESDLPSETDSHQSTHRPQSNGHRHHQKEVQKNIKGNRGRRGGGRGGITRGYVTRQRKTTQS